MTKGLPTATPYVLRHGDVWSVALDGRDLPGRHVCDGSGRMAFAYAPEEDAIYRHGEAGVVAAWARRLDPAGSVIRVVDFPPAEATLALLNACLHGLGGPLHLLERFAELDRADPSLAAIPTYPR